MHQGICSIRRPNLYNNHSISFEEEGMVEWDEASYVSSGPMLEVEANGL